MPADPALGFPDPTVIHRLGPKNAPLVALLMALLEATHLTACAIADNCSDDNRPLDRVIALEMRRQAVEIASTIERTGSHLKAA